MFLLRRCQFCGDLAAQEVDDVYLCDDLDCEAAQLFMSNRIEGVG